MNDKQKKVALVTCYFQPNYGSQLQAYATQLIFDKMKVPNETVCIDGLQGEINKAKMKYFLNRITDRNTVMDKFATVKKLCAKKMNAQYAKDVATRNGMFAAYAKSRFRVSKRYESKAELSNEAHRYAVFVVGSDQLWLPSNIEGDYYTLNFVPDEVAKLSFSTSFGVSQLPRKQAEKAAAFLKRLDAVSVREASGQKLVKQLAGREAAVVCDPTLLFTAQEWAENVPQTRFYEEKYIFCYFLGNNPWQRKRVREFRKQYPDLKIVQLKHCDEYIKSDEVFADYAPFNVGPHEFVQLIRDAEYVFTDSFHCSVFSLLHAKRFITFPRYSQNSAVSTNGRLSSLLSLVGLEHRLVTTDEHVAPIMNREIDYPSVHQKLENLRNFTKMWLQTALTNAGLKYDKY